MCEYIAPNQKKSKLQKIFEAKYPSGGSSSEGSDDNTFDKNRSSKEIFGSAKGRPKIAIAVIDTGVGIKKRERVKLFNLFGTLESTRKMNTSGIGLGLVISDNIVNAFAGKIGVRSKFKHGTKFAFSIVLGKDDDFVGDLMN